MADSRGSARAARETLLAELFGDVDVLLRRVEDLPSALDAAGARLDTAAASVGIRCEQLASLTAGLQSSAREDLSALLRRRADEAAALATARTSDEIRAVIQLAVADAVRQQLVQSTGALVRDCRRQRMHLWLALVLSGFCAAASVACAAQAWLGG